MVPFVSQVFVISSCLYFYILLSASFPEYLLNFIQWVHPNVVAENENGDLWISDYWKINLSAKNLLFPQATLPNPFSGSYHHFPAEGLLILIGHRFSERGRKLCQQNDDSDVFLVPLLLTSNAWDTFFCCSFY